MPKDITGGVPISKSQKAKARKAALLAKQGGGKTHGGTCCRCGQVSTSASPDTVHMACPEQDLLFQLAVRFEDGIEVLKSYTGVEGEGRWISNVARAQMVDEVTAYLKLVRNFTSGTWRNGFDEPINFQTGEVCFEKYAAVASDAFLTPSYVEKLSAPIKPVKAAKHKKTEVVSRRPMTQREEKILANARDRNLAETYPIAECPFVDDGVDATAS